jgi:predicted permease
MFEQVLKDIRYSLRALAHSPGFALVAVLTLAVAIAANTTVFSWVDAIMLKPVPGVTDGRQTLSLEMLPPAGQNISYLDYVDYRANLKLIDGIALSQEPIAFDIGEGGTPRRIWGELVSNNYLAVLGVRPAAGRLFNPEERSEKDLVAVISYRFWKDYFHGDPAIAGKTLRANKHNLTIIGVAAPDFGGAWRGLAFDVWVPLTLGTQLNQTSTGFLEERGARGLLDVVRLKPGVTLEQARAEVQSLTDLLARRYPETNENLKATLHTEGDAHNNVKFILSGPLRILLAMCGVVLLIACANVANLLLARATARQKELSLRLALGANRSRLTRQLLAEALLLAGLGALVGIPLAYWARHSILLLLPASEYPLTLSIPFNASILAFTVLICVVAAVVSGIVPSLHAVRSDLVGALNEGGRSGTASSGTHRMRDLLVVGEVALALVALVGAGLFAKSFRAASTIDPGFEPKNVLVSKFYLSPSGYADPQQRADFLFRLRERLESNPGVVQAGYSESIPLGFSGTSGCDIEVDGYVRPRGEGTGIDRDLVSPGYFHMLKIPILSGREFGPQDDLKSAPVAIVNQSLAKHFFGSKDPVGMQIRSCGVQATIVGLARDVKYYTFDQAPDSEWMIYMPFAQRYGPIKDYDRGVGLYIRTPGDPAQALPTLRRAVASLDPAVGVYNAMPFEDYIGTSVFPRRVAASLLTVLGVIALLLAAVGLYSVMAYSVTQRTHEIGIRMALGGQRGRVMSLILQKGLVLTLIGLAAGLVAALSASQVVASVLLNVSATDPLIFLGASLFLAVIALLASLFPARRATQVDPLVALHHE